MKFSSWCVLLGKHSAIGVFNVPDSGYFWNNLLKDTYITRENEIEIVLGTSTMIICGLKLTTMIKSVFFVIARVTSITLRVPLKFPSTL